jgi:3-phenylpropionate/trans-cinnamate dioxygenase ferredoxin component
MASQAIPVALAEAIKPGDLGVAEVGSLRIAIANVDGRFYAFDDTCTHEQCSLSEGILEETTVTCPCHGAQFDVRDGRVVALPAPLPVATYPARIVDGTIVIEV